MNDYLNKVKMAGQVFYHSAKVALKKEEIYSIALVVGIYQGLKYNGSLKRGIKGGAAVLGGYALLNGVMNVIKSTDGINGSNS